MLAGARFDPLKLTWLGTPTTETNVCIVHSRAKVKTFKDLLEHELIIGNTGVGTGTYSYPKALNGLLGTKFKLISGFPSSSDVFLAMERGEVDGICESLDSAYSKRPDWFRQEVVNILFQGGAEPNPRDQGRAVHRSTSPRPPSTSRRSNSSMPARASAGRSSRRPTCRPTA